MNKTRESQLRASKKYLENRKRVYVTMLDNTYDVIKYVADLEGLSVPTFLLKSSKYGIKNSNCLNDKEKEILIDSI